MNIKSVLNSILPITTRVKNVTEKSIQTESTADRDANGQQLLDQNQGQNQNKREPMSEEQLKKALEYLKNLPVVSEHNLNLEVVDVAGRKNVILKEPNGKIIRRIHEEELWTLQVMRDENHKKGQILRRTA